MTRDELHAELRGLADSLDEHVDADDAIRAIEDLVARIDREGLTEFHCSICGSGMHDALGHGPIGEEQR
jgi:hypothetical protein